MYRRPEQIFFQRRHTDGQQAREKMLSITNHQGNANQKYNEISSHICQDGYYQKKTTKKYWEGFGEKETLMHGGWKWAQPLWESVDRVHKN